MKVEVCLCAEPPYIIQRSNPALSHVLEYSLDEIVGRSIKVLFGPKTDTAQIYAAMKAAALDLTTIFQGNLYSKQGHAVELKICFQPQSDPSGLVRGHLMAFFDDCSGLVASSCLAACSVATAHMSAKPDQAVLNINDAFASTFGYFVTQAIGRSLRLIHGPGTKKARWDALLCNARMGISSSAELVLYSASGREVLASHSKKQTMRR